MSSTSREDRLEDDKEDIREDGEPTAELMEVLSPTFRRLQDGGDYLSREPSRSPLSQILHEEELFNDIAGEGSVEESQEDGHRKVNQLESDDQNTESTSTAPTPRAAPDRPETPSVPDDPPSRRASLMSSPGSGSQLSLPRHRRPGSLQPFDRRFSLQLGSVSGVSSPRASSPAFLATHSRQSSLASFRIPDASYSEEVQAPWEVVRWIKLKKITGTAFSEVGKRSYGRPTCLAVANQIVIGTSKGLILVFDYSQNLVATIGLGTKAVESGSVTSLAVSADHSTVAGGHQTGHIFTWEIARPAKPFLHIPPIPANQLENRRSDGHVYDKAVLHIGFLGTRHTALVSADEAGMAFSHLATRGLGVVGRVVRTVRILGRYPVTQSSNERPRKLSSVLACGPLPLGNVEQPTDSVGLTALLTPYLLVIVSTTPIAQTQHKAPRPNDVEPHSTLSGCLAWFPAVKLKNSTANSQQGVSKTKLAYSWSNVLTILEVESILAPDEDKPPEFNFRPRSRWKSEEAIVAIQWLSRSVLGVLTISQRLVILEDSNLRVTDSYDLMQKHIWHRDLFSRQLRPVVEQLDEEDTPIHGVVADAFHMSFKAYKGRLFLLGFEDVAMGTLSNWADRLVALIEEGDYIAAIELATSYYTGEADKLTIGLPENATARHNMVQERLLEMITASLKFTFPQVDRQPNGEAQRARYDELAAACFAACSKMDELDFLFEDVYEAFAESSNEDVFFRILEPYILDETISSVPPDVLQTMVAHYTSMDRAPRLEDMLIRLDTTTLNIDNTLVLCKQYLLFNALIYIYNKALRDYISPLAEMLVLMDVFKDGEIPEQYEEAILKIFPYLAYCLTGRFYPGGDAMDDEEGDKAKAQLYRFVFSGRGMEWPPESGDTFLVKGNDSQSPSYPYLRRILQLDASSFLSVLNEAFEDNFLNGQVSGIQNGTLTPNRRASVSVLPTRQTIISILLEVMTSSDFQPEDTIYLDMFLARNLPKFPQFIFLPGSALHRTLEGLCHYPSKELAADCELSVEYLLSQYHPSDLNRLIPLFEQAHFYRVLKSVYRGEKEYAKLLETCFADTEHPESVFDTISSTLRPSSGLTSKQLRDIQAVVLDHTQDLASIDAAQSARVLATYAPKLFELVIDKLPQGSRAQFVMLQTVLEPESAEQPAQLAHGLEKTKSAFEERYVQLMCQYNPTHVADYVNLLKSGDLRLDRVLPSMENSGAVDAAVVLMARDGMVREAMARLVKHMGTLRTALTSLIESSSDNPDSENLEETMEDLLQAIEKYSKVGVWLCQGQTRNAAKERPPKRKLPSATAAVSEDILELDERLWLELIDVIIAMSKEISSAIDNVSSDVSHPSRVNGAHISSVMRRSVQQTFSALLASTTSFSASGPSVRRAKRKGDPLAAATDNEAAAQEPQPLTSVKPPQQSQSNPSFLLILRAFLSRASARLPTLSDLRAVLADVFSAYSFEAHVLELANQFLDKDVFSNVADGYERRVVGWRPKSAVCEVCGQRVWGPGTGGGVWDAWEEKRLLEEDTRAKKLRAARDEGGGKGKGKSNEVAGIMADATATEEKPGQGALVVFACGHLAHRTCLEEVEEEDAAIEDDQANKKAFKCPVDG